MAKTRYTDAEFIQAFEQLGPAAAAREMGVTDRAVHFRRVAIEKRTDRVLVAPVNRSQRLDPNIYLHRTIVPLDDGIIIVGSDAHYWPGLISTAHRGIVSITRQLRPNIICLNGDGFDGASASRHPPIGWGKKPSVSDELIACDERLTEWREAAPSKTRCLWSIGNHDSRFENRLVEKAPEFCGVKGTRLGDHFPHWKIGMSWWINDDFVIKHRWKGGVHATHNNTLNAGRTFITGHLHSLKVTPFSDYNGTRWGVDTGTLADPYGEQFEYDEDNPKNHRSGFVVLTVRHGMLLWPEIARVIDKDHIDFRGEIISV